MFMIPKFKYGNLSTALKSGELDKKLFKVPTNVPYTLLESKNGIILSQAMGLIQTHTPWHLSWLGRVMK